MANLNSTDLMVYCQLTGCRLSVLSKKFIEDLKFGKKCTIKDRETLLLLNIYLEILQCYKVLCDGDIASTATFQINSIDNGTTIDISIGVVTVGSLIASGTNTTTAMSTLTDSINSNTLTSGVSALFTNGDPGIITLTGPCNNPLYSTNTVGGIDFTTTLFTGGVCSNCGEEVIEENNCFTELEIHNIIEKIETLGKLCFLPPGTTYTTE